MLFAKLLQKWIENGIRLNFMGLNLHSKALTVIVLLKCILCLILALFSRALEWSVTLLFTGIKIVQQIAILMGCAILPHLKSLVEIIEHGLVDEQQKVRTITALAIAALAEAATPYGIESFDSVLKPLWKGIRTHRGKVRPMVIFKSITYGYISLSLPCRSEPGHELWVGGI